METSGTPEQSVGLIVDLCCRVYSNSCKVQQHIACNCLEADHGD